MGVTIDSLRNINDTLFIEVLEWAASEWLVQNNPDDVRWLRSMDVGYWATTQNSHYPL